MFKGSLGQKHATRLENIALEPRYHMGQGTALLASAKLLVLSVDRDFRTHINLMWGLNVEPSSYLSSYVRRCSQRPERA